MVPTEPKKTEFQAWARLEPYAQLIRSLLPRASAVTVFDGDGRARWSSEPTGPGIADLVDETMSTARASPESGGQQHMLGEQPAYLFWLRDDANRLVATVAVLCRAGGAGKGEPPSFAFAHSLLRPALECLRRDLLARTTIESLTRTVAELDKDLELLLADAGDGADDLKSLLQSAVEHLKCGMSALIVPEKGIVLIRAEAGRTPDSQLLARTHRSLVSMAQSRREPLILNQVAPGESLGRVPYRILSCPVRHAGGRTIGVLALFRDAAGPAFVDRDARLADILARKAASIIESNYDTMSGLFTRSAFEQRVRAIVAEAKRTPWSALYIDSDQLHVINDNFGMHVGDTIIGQLGELIRRRLPPGAFAARISGDRFAALLPSNVDDAASFAEALREGAEQLSAAHADSRLHVSISVGVAPLDCETGERTYSLATAETACKAAKDRGRNRVEVYAPSDASIVRRFTDINIATGLREALALGRMRLDAQMIMPMNPASGSPPHFELLIRMIGDDGRTIGPDSFLSAANRYQLMPTLDRWVIDQALAMIGPHAEELAKRPVVFAVNFSGQSLNDAEFCDYLLSRIEESGLDPRILCFELTENATIASIARAEVLIRRLRRLGCSVALDDFGTGLSSLSYLRQLPVTMLKIDGSFVRDILKDPRAESMVRAIAQLARGMSLSTVAEYVETDEIRARISTLGVDYGQGYAIGRPEPFADVLARLPTLAGPPRRSNEDSRPALRAASLY